MELKRLGLCAAISVALHAHSSAVFAQACAHMSGTWTITDENGDVGTLYVSHGGGGSISGTANPYYCFPGWAMSGTWSSGDFAGTVTNPLYPDFMYGCNEQTGFEGEVTAPECDRAVGTYVNLGMGNFSLRKSCDVPSNETYSWSGWFGALPTIGQWDQQLSHTYSMGGRFVEEHDPGIGAVDSCHYTGSPYPPVTGISGGTWEVESDSTWGYDYIGWLPDPVGHYRTAGRAPCGATFNQDMYIWCTGADEYYKTWALGGFITTTEVGSKKGSTTVWRTYP